MAIAKKPNKIKNFFKKAGIKLKKAKETLKKIFTATNFEEVIEYTGYLVVFGIPFGFGLFLMSTGHPFLAGIGVISLLWVFDKKLIKMLRALWFR